MPTRWGRAGIVALLCCVSGHAFATDWRVLSEAAGGTQLRLELRIPPPLRIETEVDGMPFTRFQVPDANRVGAPGTPELLVLSRLVALPPEGEATLQVVELEAVDAGEVDILPRPFLGVSYGPGGSPNDPSSGMAEEWIEYRRDVYGTDGPRNEAATLGPVGMLRHVRVASVNVWPLLYDPSTRHLRIVQRVVVELRFRGAMSAATPMLRLQTPRPWQQIYDLVLLNAASASRWLEAPRRSERVVKPLGNGLLPPGLLAEDEWKLRVGSTGPLRVPAAVLLGAGFPPGTPVDRLRLVLKRFDPAFPLVPRIVEIPLHIEDDGDGFFGNGDAFVFYAERPLDDATAGERAQRYSFTNVYWLSVAVGGTPARMAVRGPLSGTVPGPAGFAQDLVVEEDRVLNQWVYGDNEELYFLLDRAQSGTEARWTVAVPGRAATSDLQICVDTQQDYMRRPFDVTVQMASGQRLALASHLGVPPPPLSPPPRIVVCGTIPVAQVEPGDVTVILTASITNSYTPFVDNIRLRYTADYRATADRVRCTSGGATGPTAFAITGMSGQPVLGFDVTDPKTPAVFDLGTSLSGGTLTLTDDVPPAATRVYEVAPRAGLPVLSAVQVQRDTPDPILEELALPLGTYDMLVVVHDDFAQDPKLQEWKAFRESQGVRIRIIRTSDVYDAFTGGLLHYDAIYDLVHEAYRNWGIGYVLLVGDGSEDAAGLLPNSGPDLVPARMRYFGVRPSAGGDYEYRNDIYERHYSKMDGDSDPYPDLLLGRWPVGTAQELGAIVDKTLVYEQPAANDDGRWRKRVLLFSDDEWVRRVSPDNTGIDHRRGCEEWNFYFSIRCACETVRNAFPGDLQCVLFPLHEWSNRLAQQGVPEHQAWPFVPPQVPCPPPQTFPRYPFQNCGAPDYAAPHRGPQEVFFYNGTVARALTDSVGEGVLFFALQSHANRRTVSDEQVMSGRPDPDRPFVPDFNNQGKYFVFFGFGCHLNEFGIPNENAFGNGESLGELYLMAPGRAAVASYASTGFEYLGANNDFHEHMWSTIFEKRYQRGLGGGTVNSDTLQADWRLAALLEVAEISNGDIDIVDRFSLLGDPLLRIDAGVPRFKVVSLENGFFLDGRIGANAPTDTVRVTVNVSDEQGIDSLWVEKRFRDGRRVPLPAQITAIAGVDTAAQIRAKRGYQVKFEVMFDTCDFDLALGARDMAGRVSELYGRGQFEQRLYANGLEVQSGSVVDARTSFRYQLESCTPDSVLGLTVFLDGLPVQGVTSRPDTLFVTWMSDFAWDVPPGTHDLRFVLDGNEITALTLVVEGALGLHDVLAFPNPFADKTHFFFNLDATITGGHVRIMDLNGRTVRTFDLGAAGTLQDLRPEPGPGGGTTMAMNYVEWDGTDTAGDHVANGVYFYEVRITGASGQEIRKRDKVVVMR